MHRVDKKLGLGRRRELVDAVPEVADMAPGLAAACENFCHPGPQFFFWQQQGNGVEVALHRNMRADLGNRLGNVHAPVEAKHISA